MRTDEVLIQTRNKYAALLESAECSGRNAIRCVPPQGILFGQPVSHGSGPAPYNHS